jgi:GNAT superfamily N-acetyltransferase
MTDVSIRPFTDEDYEFLVTADRAIYDEYPRSIEQWMHDDATRDPAMFFARHVVEVGGEPRGCGEVGHSGWIDNPNKYWFQILVLPLDDDDRIRTAYLDFALRTLAPRQPKAVVSGMLESRGEHTQFLENNGFREVHRERFARLELDNFLPTQFESQVRGVVDQGIRMVALTDLQSEVADWKSRLHPVYQQLVADQPAPDEPRLDTLERWEQTVLGSPDFDPALWIIALDGERIVGLSQAALNLEDRTTTDCGLTGVVGEYRRRGIATALKIELLAAVKICGAARISTANEQNNPMYQINVGLGFEPRPDWVMYERRL